jgi:NAD(P)-dependent dehydrogenase (short-subunit alcohol dehydrogenase family)
MKSCVIGASGRLGRVVAATLRDRGDEIQAFPEGSNYLVFAHRWRPKIGPDRHAEFAANVWMVADTIESMKWADGDRAVVIVASVSANEPALNQSLAYNVSKAAQCQVARYMSKSMDIRVNTVSPNTFTGPDAVISPRQVADVITFLCSERANGINGQDIRIG